MKFYETTIIMDPKLSEEDRETQLKKIQDILTADKGEIIEIEKQGVKKTAFTIKKQREAYYVIFRHNSEGSSIDRLRGQLKLNESVYRYLVVLVSPEKGKVPVERKPEEEPA